MAKIEPRLITTAPNVSSPSGEQHYMDKMFPGSPAQSGDYTKYSPNDRFLEPDNGIFDVGGKGKSASEKVKTFDRMAKHFGYDQKTSIEKYDENVTLDDRLKNSHKKSKLRNFFDKSGQWKGASTAYKTNHEAKKEHKKVIIVKEESNFKKITDRIKKKEGYPKKNKKLSEGVIVECVGSREWAMNKIMFPNSQGQGHCEDHCKHPLHNTITRNNFKYSHTTPIGNLGKENEYYLHHTYANGEHKVGIDDKHTNRWESKTSSASGHRVTGTGLESLNNHLSRKVKKYRLEPVQVSEAVARSTQKSFADSDGKMKQTDAIDKKNDKVDKVKGFIKTLRDKKKD